MAGLEGRPQLGGGGGAGLEGRPQFGGLDLRGVHNSGGWIRGASTIRGGGLD